MILHTASRSLHDLGLAARFGGTLANAVALNRAAGRTRRLSDAGAVTNSGWDDWTPVNAAAIGAHVAGSVGQLLGNRGRVAGQAGVGTMSVVKTGLTVAALGASGYARSLGKQVSRARGRPDGGRHDPNETTPEPVAKAQRQLTASAVGGAGPDRSARGGQRLRRRATAPPVGDRRVGQPAQLIDAVGTDRRLGAAPPHRTAAGARAIGDHRPWRSAQVRPVPPQS